MSVRTSGSSKEYAKLFTCSQSRWLTFAAAVAIPLRAVWPGMAHFLRPSTLSAAPCSRRRSYRFHMWRTGRREETVFKEGRKDLMNAQQVAPQQQQIGNEQGTEQVSQANLAQALQPIMSQVEQEIEQIIRQQMDQAMEPLRQGMGQMLDQAHGAPQQPVSLPDAQSGQPAQPTQAASAAPQDMGQPEDQQERQGQHGQPEQGKTDEESPLVAVLRQQIMEAMDPVIDDLRENVEQAVQQQMEYVLKMGEEELHQQVQQAAEPLRQEVQQQVDQSVLEARQERERPPQTKLQEAIQRTVKALKETMQWLARTLRALLKAVVALLKAVVNLLVVVLLALFEGLKSLGQATGQGMSSIGGGIMGGVKKMLANSVKGLVSNLLTEPDSAKKEPQPQAAA